MPALVTDGGDAWEQVVGFGPLVAAFGRAFRGNRRNPEACRFHLELARISHHHLLRRAIAAQLRGLLPALSSTHRKCACGELRSEVREDACSHPPRDGVGEKCRLVARLLALSAELRSLEYAPAPYRFFRIRQPKRRLISVASFRDRVVHHTLVGALEPRFEPRFIRHSYACRGGKGTYRALRQAQRWCRRFPYYLKTDVDDYFATIDHMVLSRLLARVTSDRRVRWLCRRVMDNARLPTVPPGERRGLPIGNLTSQFWANVYLDPLDHFVRDDLHQGAYMRYINGRRAGLRPPQGPAVGDAGGDPEVRQRPPRPAHQGHGDTGGAHPGRGALSGGESLPRDGAPGQRRGPSPCARHS